MAERNLPFSISTEAKPDGVELTLQMGGFKDKAEAEDFAKVMVQFIEEVGNEVWTSRVQ